MAAATRGSDGVDALDVGIVETVSDGDTDVPTDERKPVGVAVALSDALGPGFGDPLLLHPASGVINNTAAIAAPTTWNLRIDHLADKG